MPRFVKGQSGNPRGRPHRLITNLGAEARKWTDLAISTLVQVCQGAIKGVTPRDRVAAANAILDRGYGKPTQSIDMVLLGKKLSELSTAELIELNSKLVSVGAAGDTEQPLAEEALH